MRRTSGKGSANASALEWKLPIALHLGGMAGHSPNPTTRQLRIGRPLNIETVASFLAAKGTQSQTLATAHAA